MKRKFKLGNEELEFEITNKTIFDIDEKYGNYGIVINSLMQNEKLYNNALKIMSCSCVTRELSEDEIIEKLTPIQLTQELIKFVIKLYFDYVGIKPESKKDEDKKETKKKEI